MPGLPCVKLLFSNKIVLTGYTFFFAGNHLKVIGRLPVFIWSGCHLAPPFGQGDWLGYKGLNAGLAERWRLLVLLLRYPQSHSAERTVADG